MEGKDMMALLVVVGLGGLVLWYLTSNPTTNRQPAPQPAPPCGGSYAGASINCAGVDYVLNKASDIGQGAWNYTLGQVLPESLRFGSTKVCRSTITGKDVWPNDITMCAKLYGVTDCNKCGGYYSLAARRWPWQDPNFSETQVSQQPLVPIMGR